VSPISPQTVTVEGAASVAANWRRRKAARYPSAKSEISQASSQLHRARLDYTEVLTHGSWHFQRQPQRSGPRRQQDLFPRLLDGQYTMTFDGIPFNDTNSPTHPSWSSSLPNGSAGPILTAARAPPPRSGHQLGGSVNLMSRPVTSEPDIRGTATYGVLQQLRLSAWIRFAAVSANPV